MIRLKILTLNPSFNPAVGENDDFRINGDIVVYIVQCTVYASCLLMIHLEVNIHSKLLYMTARPVVRYDVRCINLALYYFKLIVSTMYTKRRISSSIWDGTASEFHHH